MLKAHSCERRIHFYVTVLGDIDPEFNVVEVTDEAKEKLSKIKNKIGGFGCKLCKQEFEDAFGLAQHRYYLPISMPNQKNTVCVCSIQICHFPINFIHAVCKALRNGIESFDVIG